MKSLQFQKKALSLHRESGSILQSIRSSDLKKIKIILPPKEVQKSIGDKLKDAVYAAAQARTKIETADNDILNLV